LTFKTVSADPLESRNVRRRRRRRRRRNKYLEEIVIVFHIFDIRNYL
jgi:hypothetical protein